jgi:hypothetical protein
MIVMIVVALLQFIEKRQRNENPKILHPFNGRNPHWPFTWGLAGNIASKIVLYTPKETLYKG